MKKNNQRAEDLIQFEKLKELVLKCRRLEDKEYLRKFKIDRKLKNHTRYLVELALRYPSKFFGLYVYVFNVNCISVWHKSKILNIIDTMMAIELQTDEKEIVIMSIDRNQHGFMLVDPYEESQKTRVYAILKLQWVLR